MSEVCLLLAGSYGSTDVLKYQLQGKITANKLCVPIAYPNFGISDWELEAGREMLDQAFSDWSGDDITVLAHSAGSRVANLWLHDYGQTRFDDSLVPATTKFYNIGDSTNWYGGVYFEVDHAPPKDTPYDVTVITRQYDGFADYPGDITNNDAVTNSIYGQPYVHPDYFGIDPSPTADGNYLFTEQNIKYIYSQTYPMPSVIPSNTLLKQWGLSELPTTSDWVSLEDQAKRPAVDAAYAVVGKRPRPVLIPPPAYG